MKNADVKVLLVGTTPPPVGGDATWTLQYIKYCENRGYKIYLIDKKLIGKRALTMDLKYNLLDEMVRCLRIWKNMFVGLRKFKPHVVHINTNCSGNGIIRDYVCGLLSYVAKVPVVIHCHCNIEDQLENSKLGIKYFVKFAKISSGIFVLNSASQEYVSKKTGSFAQIIPNYINREMVLGQKLINKDIKQVVFVGHIRKAKGVVEIIDVAKKNPEIKFILVGPITEEICVEKVLSESMGNIEFVGPKGKEEVQGYLDVADVFLFPSYTEGFSLALLEAMSRGLPIIATDVGANKDMVGIDGGIIVQPQKSEEIISALLKMQDARIRTEMSKINIQKVNQFYIIDKVIENMRKAYLEVINEKNM